jgi:hypothetical protein
MPESTTQRKKYIHISLDTSHDMIRVDEPEHAAAHQLADDLNLSVSELCRALVAELYEIRFGEPFPNAPLYNVSELVARKKKELLRGR